MSIKGTVSRWWPFALLLTVSASRWIVADLHPQAAPSLASAALGCGWAAVLAFTFIDKESAQVSNANGLRGLIAGAMLFGGPAIGLLMGAHQLNAGALTMALALTPVAVAIGAAAFGAETSQGVAGRIWPGLAAVTGLLLILVQPDVANTFNDIALLLAPALTGVGAALLDSAVPSGAESRPPVAHALIGAAALFGFATVGAMFVAGHRPALCLLAIGYEGVLALLSLLAFSRLGATRWSSQFTWLPLLILTESIVMVRPPITGRWVTGIVLLAVASVYLLLPQAEEPEAAPSLVRRV